VDFCLFAFLRYNCLLREREAQLYTPIRTSTHFSCVHYSTKEKVKFIYSIYLFLTIYYMTDARAQFFETMEGEWKQLDDADFDNDDMDAFPLNTTATNTTTASLSIPMIPLQQQQNDHQQTAASSHGSSGSAFMNAVLSPNNTTSFLAHTPPQQHAAESSYEASHFGKRARSGSVSGRLRSASDYLQDRGLLDAPTRSALKDLIIIGDEELQRALDSYEQQGDASALEDMISNGALQNRLPPDLDLLGDLDLDLDFLTMNDVGLMESSGSNRSGGLGIPPPQRGPSPHLTRKESLRQPSTVSPHYDDGIGDLEFAGEFMGTTHHTNDHHTNSNSNADDYNNSTNNMELQQHPLHHSESKQTSASGSPAEFNTGMSEYEKRMRSNSLFSALLNDDCSRPRGDSTATAAAQYGRWMGQDSEANSGGGGIHIARRTSPPDTARSSGLAAALSETEQPPKKKTTRPYNKKIKPEDKQKSSSSDVLMSNTTPEEEYVPGSGRPRSLSDPNLTMSVDEHGLAHVTRPDGWVGAYSPESRKVRVERFVQKRDHRVWSKKIKYDVRKNFADSRLRVKGRFVRKEDETLMRELMSLT
jgi:hypothetical protein